MEKFKIDDAIYASAVHGSCGIWGVLATGLFNMNVGAFYAHSSKQIFWWQLAGIVTIVAWSAFWTAIICFVCKLLGKLKYSDKVQDEGIDCHHHMERTNERRTTVVRQTGSYSSSSSTSDGHVTQIRDLA